MKYYYVTWRLVDSGITIEGSRVFTYNSFFDIGDAINQIKEDIKEMNGGKYSYKYSPIIQNWISISEKEYETYLNYNVNEI